ncbi:MAG: T9SS type A sorting domain-containing protein [Tannerellaceae bacterium]|jgi:hypothetical protein|nr:T9SS type A sorting domain-containing protein [Tannerellaceae bacterium]
MKPQFIKFVAFIALLTGSFSLSAQRLNPSFAIDENITSFEVANLADKIVYEHLPKPGYGGLNAFSPHHWRITLIMEEGTDVTALSPIITLAPGATITSVHARVQDFSQQVDYTVIAEDGSTVTYKVSAYAQKQTRASQTIIILCSPPSGGTTNPAEGIFHYHDDMIPFVCMAYPANAYRFDSWEIHGQRHDTSLSNPFYGRLPGYHVTFYAIFEPAVQNTYTVIVQSEDTNRGTVSGGGTCYQGGTVSVSASPKAGWKFEGWYLNGVKVSGSASFNYTPSASCTLIAKFSSLPISPSLSGPSLVLNSGSTYTLTGGSGGTVTWTYSSNLRMRSSSNTSITVESLSTSAGTGWIQASVGGISTPRYEVWVGKPVITGIFGETLITHPEEYGFYYYAQYNEKASITSFDWVFMQGIDPTFWSSTSKSWIYNFIDDGSYQLCVRATNANGTGNYYPISITVDFPGMSPSPPSAYRISQDPASNELTVTPDTSVSQLAPLSPSSGAASNYTVYLYNAGGAVVKQAVSQQGGEVRLDVSGLPNGIYYLLIDTGDGSKPESHKIIINH